MGHSSKETDCREAPPAMTACSVVKELELCPLANLIGDTAVVIFVV